MVDKGFLDHNLAGVGKLQHYTYIDKDNEPDVLREAALEAIFLEFSKKINELENRMIRFREIEDRRFKEIRRELQKIKKKTDELGNKIGKGLAEIRRSIGESSWSDQGSESKEASSSSSQKIGWQDLTDLSDLTWKHCLQAAKISSKLSTSNTSISEPRVKLKERINDLNKKLREYKPSFFEILCSIITFSFTYFKVQLMKAALRPLQEEGLSRKKLTAR